MAASRTDSEVRIGLRISKGTVARWAGVTDGAISRHEASGAIATRGRTGDIEAWQARVDGVYLAMRVLLEAVLARPRSKAGQS